MKSYIGKRITSILERDSSLKSDSIIVAQFLLCLHKENLLTEFSINEDFNSLFITKNEELPNYQKDEWISIYTYLRRLIDNIHRRNLLTLVEEICSFSVEETKQCFYSLLNELERSQKQLIFESDLLAELLVKYADFKKDSKVLNPFGRSGAIDVKLENVNLKSIHDRHTTVQVIYKLRMIIEEKMEFSYTNDINNRHGNIPDELYLMNEQFDYIISDLPLGKSLNNHKKVGYDYTRAATIVLEEGIHKLTDRGEIIISCSSSFGTSNRKDELQLRERLIRENLLDTVIYLPNALSEKSNVSIFILKIKRGRAVDEGIKMIDGSLYFDFIDSDSPLFDIEAFLREIKFRNDICKTVTYNHIVSNKYVLDPRRYLIEAKGVKLKEILRPCKMESVFDESSPKVISDKNLSGLALMYYIKPSDAKSGVKSNQYYEVNPPCLLVSRNTKEFRIALYLTDEGMIKIHPNIMAFNIINREVDASKLVRNLLNPQFSDQVAAYSSGVTMPRISIQDFLELKISLESVIDDLSQEEKKAEEDFKKSIEEYVVQKDEQYYVNIASLNHSIGTARQNILSSANIISNYINYSIDDPIVSDFMNKFKSDNGYDFIELPNGIRNDIGLISRTLKNGFEGLKLENYVKESVPVLEISNIIKQEYRPGYNFRLILKSDVEDENKSRLSINTDLFKILVTNIFENAHKHGFESKSDENIVEVEIYQIGHMLTIGISNNGLPFPDGFTQEQFEQKYTLSAESKGTGIGGYDIKRIIDYFGGNLTLLTYGLAKDSVEFLINLPEEFLTYEEE